ncbi:MAG: IS630 family transposase [Parahaliea sp.]
MWCIPPKGDAHFVYQMEAVLGVYKRPQKSLYPAVCMDETSVQCTKEVSAFIAAKPGQSERYDTEYERNGLLHLILFYAPFKNWRRIQVADNHAACEWTEGVRRLVGEDYPNAKRITLVMDNLNTHSGASLYKAFSPEKARALLEKLAFVYTPKYGSWLNMAECKFSVLSRQCLARRLPDMETVMAEVGAWLAVFFSRKMAQIISSRVNILRINRCTSPETALSEESRLNSDFSRSSSSRTGVLSMPAMGH